MHLSPDQLVQQIHDAPTRIVLAATGGGARAIADLLEVPGGSRTLLEAAVPYSTPSMVAWLGGKPDEFCSAPTARAMAMAAFERARLYDEPDDLPVGVACTASLVSDRPKRGPHRIHIALQTVAQTVAWWLRLHKDRRSRVEEERLAGRLLLNVVAEACGVAERLDFELLEGEQVERTQVDAPIEWQQLLLSKIETVGVHANEIPPKIVFPGTFNPLHAGHQRMVQIAGERLGSPVAVEMSIINVEKPPTDYVTMRQRLDQFPPEQAVYLTRAATFVEKSRLFPGSTFVVGIDTMRRIVLPQYYGGNLAACQAALEQIAARDCRFLVFGRDLGEGFAHLATLNLPEPLKSRCEEVPIDLFREDISSTAIRSRGDKLD